MSEKKFLDVRIECENEALLGIKHIKSLMSRHYDTPYTVTALPELASEEEIRNTFLSLAERVSIPDKINTNSWRWWAWIIDYYDLSHALVGKVVLPSPEPEKETKGIDIGVVVKDENTLISPLLIDGKVVDKVGIYPSEVENIMVWVVDRNIRINPEPPEKKEPEEKKVGKPARPSPEPEKGEGFTCGFKVGQKVIFDNPKNGYPPDQEKAIRHLIVGKTYVIKDIDEQDWRTEIYLEGDDNGFNSVLFSLIKPPEKKELPEKLGIKELDVNRFVGQEFELLLIVEKINEIIREMREGRNDRAERKV